jgi:hypothetical protein
MNIFRYRRPSLNTLLGITKAKKRIKKELGITALLKPFRWWTNTKRRFKRKIGYESESGGFGMGCRGRAGVWWWWWCGGCGGVGETIGSIALHWSVSRRITRWEASGERRSGVGMIRGVGNPRCRQ